MPVPASPSPGRAFVRAATVCLLTAVAVVVVGGDAFWLCVPAALLLAAPAATGARATGAATAVFCAALFPAVALGSAPNLLAAAAVVGASVAVVNAMRTRLEGERDALRHSSLTDPLTRLANRRALDERLDYEIARHTRQRREFTVLVLDLDGFKGVNDRFGHPAGDELLRDVAEALRDVVRDQDTVARVGGDEFCVLAPETGLAGGDQLAYRIERAVVRATSGVSALSASVGVAVFPRDGGVPAELIQTADSAQQEAKRRLYRERSSERRAA
jgi:diguanylate cyclase (GGDEF)-like protein